MSALVRIREADHDEKAPEYTTVEPSEKPGVVISNHLALVSARLSLSWRQGPRDTESLGAQCIAALVDFGKQVDRRPSSETGLLHAWRSAVVEFWSRALPKLITCLRLWWYQ